MKDNNGKIILAMLAGASAGVVAGILMAPEAGEATRGNIKKSASKLTKDLESKLQAGMDQLQSLTSKIGVGGTSSVGADPEIVSTGSNTEATSHLANNPTGGNIEAAAGAEDAPATGTSATAKRGKGATSTKTSSSDTTGTSAGA